MQQQGHPAERGGLSAEGGSAHLDGAGRGRQGECGELFPDGSEDEIVQGRRFAVDDDALGVHLCGEGGEHPARDEGRDPDHVGGVRLALGGERDQLRGVARGDPAIGAGGEQSGNGDESLQAAAATAPDGVVLEPSSGTLKVRGTRGATARVAVRATADAAAGSHPVALEFRLADGTRLVPSRVETDIR